MAAGFGRRSSFGFTGIYRDTKVFSLLRRTRALGILELGSFETRVRRSPYGRVGAPGLSNWLCRDAEIPLVYVCLSAETDLRDVLEWLLRSYEAAI